MFNIGGGELLVILLLALIVLGPQKLPGAVRTAGRVMGEVRRVSSGFQQELKTAFDEVDDGGDGGDLPRRRESAPLAGAVAEAEAEARAPSDDDDDEIADAPPAPRPGGRRQHPGAAPGGRRPRRDRHPAHLIARRSGYE